MSGAENVYSIEVEDALQRHPAVVEAAVFGVPDPVWGEAVHAVVVVGRAGPRRRALASELRDALPAAHRRLQGAQAIDIQSEPLPKSGPGKILKRVLRDPFWAGAEPSILREVARGLRGSVATGS